MNKHHPKILAFHIDKLGPEKAPIKTQFGHVPPPDVPIYGMIWIFVPRIFRVTIRFQILHLERYISIWTCHTGQWTRVFIYFVFEIFILIFEIDKGARVH